MLLDVKESWKSMLKTELTKDYMLKNLNMLIESDQVILPLDPRQWLHAFHYFELKDLNVVILGQDPYPGKCNKYYYANGLAFSVNKGLKITKSLSNIYKDLLYEYDDFEIPMHGNLLSWVDQGVLLLNTSLTVESGIPDSHTYMWKTMTDNIIKYISTQCKFIVFLLMGRKAENKKNLICKKNDMIVTCHPAADGFVEKNFFPVKPFKAINLSLSSHNKTSIDWIIL